MILRRLFPFLLLLMTLSACTAMDDPVDEQLLLRLQGDWQQLDGRSSLTIYEDESLKLSMPDENPPLRLLTAVENNKDHGIGFSVGDRWGGPVYIVLAEDGESLKLNFPPSDPRLDDGRVMSFKRTR